MLTVHQPKLFSRNLVLYDGDSPVAEIRFQTFSAGAEILVGSTSYDARRSGWFRGAYSLERDGNVVNRAEAVGFWQRTYEVRAGASLYTLRRQRGWFATGWELFDGDSLVGSVERKGFFQTQTVAEFADAIDLTTQVFIVWVANVIWQQDQSAAAAAAAA
jgi:hypothetical protein